MDELKNILIVEDRSVWVNNIKEMISEIGNFHVITATNEQEALKKLRTNGIDIAIIDLNLSDSIQQEKYEGIDIIDSIRAQGCNSSVIVLTGCIHFNEADFEKKYSVEKLFVKSTFRATEFKKVFEEVIKKRKRE